MITPKEEDILTELLQRDFYVDYEEENIIDSQKIKDVLKEYGDYVRREAIAEEREGILREINDAIVIANEEMGFHAKHNQIYWSGVKMKLEVLRRHLTQE